jgi:hypothetical protein
MGQQPRDRQGTGRLVEAFDSGPATRYTRLRMRFLPFAGCLLLLLTVISVIQTTADSAAFHVRLRHQWRVQTQEHGSARPSVPHAIAVPGGWPEAPIPPSVRPLVLAPRREVVSQLSAAVFVPPRL